MQIISELEGYRRGTYAGVVGYNLPGVALDTCIAIRTVLLRDGRAYLQAGGGIVADSDPAAEHQECLNKLAALEAALELGRGAAVTVLLLIDNYDSFTYNLAHLFGELGAEVTVIRNDAIDADEAEALAPSHLVISPGPGRPEEAGATPAIIERLARSVPTLGVCLGHQAIVQVFGGDIGQCARARARQGNHRQPRRPRHLHRASRRLPCGPLPLAGGDLGAGVFEVSATTPDGEVMAVRHRELPLDGVQFHPESVLTPLGRDIVENFLEGSAKVIQGALTSPARSPRPDA